MPRSWPRIVLTVILLGLLAWFWVLRSGKPAEVDLSTYAAPAWVMKAERIVYRSGEDSILVERRGDRFEIIHPISDHADPTRLLQTLQAAARLQPTRAMSSEDLAGFGLQPPRHRLEFRSAVGSTLTSRIPSRRTPSSSSASSVRVGTSSRPRTSFATGSPCRSSLRSSTP